MSPSLLLVTSSASSQAERVDLWQALPSAGRRLLDRYRTLARGLAEPDPDATGPAHTTDPAACARVLATGGWWGPWES